MKSLCSLGFRKQGGGDSFVTPLNDNLLNVFYFPLKPYISDNNKKYMSRPHRTQQPAITPGPGMLTAFGFTELDVKVMPSTPTCPGPPWGREGARPVSRSRTPPPGPWLPRTWRRRAPPRAVAAAQ